MKETDTVKMRREWDERSARDAFHYIHTGQKQWDDTDEFFRTGEELVEQMVDPFIKAHIKNPEDCVALDIGCGVGRLTRALSKRFKLAYGIDVSGEMINQGRSLNSHYKNIVFDQNDGETFGSIEDSTVDYIFSFVTFQHMPSEKVVQSNISEIGRVLKPGGVLQLEFPVLVGCYRLWGAVPVPRTLKQYIPQSLFQIYRSRAIPDPLKRTETFRGVTFTKRKAERLFSKYHLECTFQNHPTSTSKLMVEGIKRS